MDRLHEHRERAERQRRDAGERRFQHDGECAELQRCNAAEHRRKRQAQPGLARGKISAHQGPVDKEISHEAAVERHVPDIRAQRKQPSVSKEQRLNGKNDDHGQKACPRPQHGGQQHTAAQMPGRACAGDGIVDHLPGKDERGHDRHCRKLLFCRLRCGKLLPAQLHERNARRSSRGCVHRNGDSRR